MSAAAAAAAPTEADSQSSGRYVVPAVAPVPGVPSGFGPGGRTPVLRFDGVQRAAHWLTAALVLTVTVTGVILYVPSFSLYFGQRLLIEDIHVYTGIAMFVPLVFLAAGPWGRRLRADLKSMNRFSTDELSWLRSLGRRGRRSIGKFNPGQKLNTIGIGSLLFVLSVTGVIMRWGNALPIRFLTGATFVHDWFALAVVVVVAGHILFALTHPPALRSMVTGKVTRSWTLRHAPAWRAEEEAKAGAPEPDGPTQPAASDRGATAGALQTH